MESSSIQDLPEEILPLIFKYVAPNEKLQLLLVCRHWKNLLESHHIFNKLTFLKYKKSERDFAIVSNSKRKYKCLSLGISLDNMFKVNKVKRIIQNNEKTLKELEWILGNDNEVLEDSFEYFYDLLKCTINFETISMNFINYEFESKVDDPSRAILEFKKLKNLDIKWKRTDAWYGNCNLEEEFKATEAEIARVLEEARVESTSSVRQRPDIGVSSVQEKNLSNQIENPRDQNDNLDISDIPEEIRDPEQEIDEPPEEYDDTDDEERELEDVIARNLFPIIKTPLLEKVRIDTPGYNFQDSLRNILSFLNENCQNLNSLYLYKENCYGFIWSPESLHVWYSSDVSEEIDKFLPGRNVNLKQFKIHCKENKRLALQILNEAKDLEHFETSAFIPLFFARETFTQVKILTVWKLELTRNRILKMHLNFPNVEIIRFAYVDLKNLKKEKKFFQDTFPNLKDLQYYNKSTKFYDSVL